MSTAIAPQQLSDDDLLRRLTELLAQTRRTEAELLAHIAEVDARRLYAREACPSMFVYCTERLHLSEAEAYMRITAARAAREHPALLSMVADGRLHLSAIARLAPLLTADNRDAVLARATHRSKREILELVADLSPRPDAPTSIRKLPDSERTAGRVDREGGLGGSRVATGSTTADSDRGNELFPDRVVPRSSEEQEAPAAVRKATGVPSGGPDPSSAPSGALDIHTAALAVGNSRPEPTRPRPAGPPTRGSVEPIAPGRYKVQFTATADLREKLVRLQSLMGGTAAEGDLAAVIEAAVTEKLQRLEARRGARVAKPRKTLRGTDTRPRARHVPAAVRRAVRERDKGQCRFVGRDGRRCSERRHLEFHHRHPFGMGGDHAVDNVQLMCRTHNRYVGEADYGKSHYRPAPQRGAEAGHCQPVALAAAVLPQPSSLSFPGGPLPRGCRRCRAAGPAERAVSSPRPLLPSSRERS